MSKTMLDKIGIIGDAKTAFNRIGIDTLAVVCIGGTNGTAVKVQHCDTVGGSYTDFKTLDSGHADLNKGFTFSLEGAKKFVKIVGCDVAVGIVGDCDYDVKKVSYSAVALTDVDLEDNKSATINVSTYTAPVEVTPTSGKDGMKKATITLSHIPELETSKAVSIDASTYTEPVEIEPTEGKDGMKKVVVTLTGL